MFFENVFLYNWRWSICANILNAGDHQMAGGRGQPSIDMFIENDSFQMHCVSKKLTAREHRKEKLKSFGTQARFRLRSISEG
jgi:hypothetical protein